MYGHGDRSTPEGMVLREPNPEPDWFCAWAPSLSQLVRLQRVATGGGEFRRIGGWEPGARRVPWDIGIPDTGVRRTSSREHARDASVLPGIYAKEPRAADRSRHCGSASTRTSAFIPIPVSVSVSFVTCLVIGDGLSGFAVM